MYPKPKAITLLNQTKSVFLRSLREPRDNQLELILEEALVKEARRGEAPRRGELPESLFSKLGLAQIESVDGCLVYRLFWQHYAAYLVTEELVGSNGQYDDEQYQGTILRSYLKSHFLEHFARDTGCHSGPLQHYKIVCLNHLIDVAADAPPEVEIIST
jgi:hypothetical protein